MIAPPSSRFRGEPRIIKSWSGAALVAAAYTGKSDSGYYIGLDCEGNQHQSTNPRPHPTIQGRRLGWVDVLSLSRINHATGEVETADVFQLGQIKNSNGGLPPALSTLLRNPGKLFTGVNIPADMTRLMNHYPSLQIPAQPRDATKSNCINTHPGNWVAHELNPETYATKVIKMEDLVLD